MSKIDINEIEKVYASCGADNNRVLNTNLNRGRLNSGIKCGFFPVSGRNSEHLRKTIDVPGIKN